MFSSWSSLGRCISRMLFLYLWLFFGKVHLLWCLSWEICQDLEIWRGLRDGGWTERWVIGKGTSYRISCEREDQKEKRGVFSRILTLLQAYHHSTIILSSFFFPCPPYSPHHKLAYPMMTDSRHLEEAPKRWARLKLRTPQVEAKGIFLLPPPFLAAS